MRWLMVVGAALIVLVGLVFVAGVVRPAEHVASTRSELSARPADVWVAVSDWESWAQWQPEISGVERLPDRRGHPTLRTSGSWGDMLMEVVESEAPRRFVTVVDGGAFRGRWTYELEPVGGGGTRLTITEEGEVSNPFFRAMMIFHDNYETMLNYHRALGDRLGVTVEPVRVEIEAEREDGGDATG